MTFSSFRAGMITEIKIPFNFLDPFLSRVSPGIAADVLFGSEELCYVSECGHHQGIDLSFVWHHTGHLEIPLVVVSEILVVVDEPLVEGSSEFLNSLPN